MATTDNLKRGKLKSDTAKANSLANLKAGGGDPAAGLAAIEAQRKAREELGEQALASPDDALLSLYKAAVIAAERGLSKWNRKGGEPSRLTIEATKEARQLCVVALDIIRARGAATESERFFAEVASRISTANLGEGPQPVGEVSGP